MGAARQPVSIDICRDRKLALEELGAAIEDARGGEREKGINAGRAAEEKPCGKLDQPYGGLVTLAALF
jgi:hypothetical protein